MKIYNCKDVEILETNRKIKIVLSDGQEFYISEEHNELIVNGVDGNLQIAPRYANEIGIKEG